MESSKGFVTADWQTLLQPLRGTEDQLRLDEIEALRRAVYQDRRLN
jgi:hypothetical protein